MIGTVETGGRRTEPAATGQWVHARPPQAPVPGAAAGGPRGRIETPHREAVDLEIVIRALNQERRIGFTVEALVAYLGRQCYRSALVVVDNGSVDRTADVVAELEATSPVPVHLINCSRRGKGAAVRYGILTSRARYVGFCDAAVATPVETLDRVWPLLEQGAQVVIGTRHFDGAPLLSPQTHLRRLGGALFRAPTDSLLPEVADTQSGFKVFEGVAVRELLARCTVDGFVFDLELLVAARAAGLRVHELPVAWSDRPGSSFRPLRDGLRSMGDLLFLAQRRYAQGATRRR
jgi:dolichyl-phosphate beta-glucosyltransferase